MNTNSFIQIFRKDRKWELRNLLQLIIYGYGMFKYKINYLFLRWYMMELKD